MDRITNTDKWKDEWFLGLSAHAKLLFFYLCENCDVAGFYKLNSRFMQKQTNINAKDIVDALNDLKKAIVFNNSTDKTNKKIWVKNFLFYQQQLPLEKNNPAHKKIALIIEKNLSEFNNNNEMLYILDKVSTTTSKKIRTRFVIPTLIEFNTYAINYAKEKNIIDLINKSWAEKLYAYYKSKGWKVGKSPMKDWEAAIEGAILREIESGVSKTSQGKIDKLKAANQNMSNIEIKDHE